MRAILLLLLLLPACPLPPVQPRPPVNLSLQIGTKQSCGVFSGLDYDTSCMAAVYVAVHDFPTGTILSDQCTVLEARKAELGQLLRGEKIINFSGVSTNQRVTFEVRGLHDVSAGAADRCSPDEIANDDFWLFWGESDPIDLARFEAAGENIVIPVVVDCRDCSFECPEGDCFGCAALGDTCPAALPLSFCVPGVSFECDKRCDDDDDCFEGARTCLESGFCDTREPTGGLCSPCGLVDGSVEGCAGSFICVGPPGATQGFCAESCPDTFCPTGTRCNRVGNNLSVIQP